MTRPLNRGPAGHWHSTIRDTLLYRTTSHSIIDIFCLFAAQSQQPAAHPSAVWRHRRRTSELPVTWHERRRWRKRKWSDEMSNVADVERLNIVTDPLTVWDDVRGWLGFMTRQLNMEQLTRSWSVFSRYLHSGLLACATESVRARCGIGQFHTGLLRIYDCRCSVVWLGGGAGYILCECSAHTTQIHSCGCKS